jgi:hypothetical protein
MVNDKGGIDATDLPLSRLLETASTPEALFAFEAAGFTLIQRHERQSWLLLPNDVSSTSQYRPETERFVHAASGLVCVGATLYVVADDELHLTMFSTDTSEPGRLIRLFDGYSATIRMIRILSRLPLPS